MFWLVDDSDIRDDIRDTGFIKRFDPRYWTVNFPRPMMAAITNPAAGTLKVNLVFYRNDDLAGLIWTTEDTVDHPLLRYETSKDYSGVVLQFRWQSTNVRDLGQLNGPTLTIEGRDSLGNPKTWYVRLWNYAEGTVTDSVITLDFNNLDGGFLLPDEADPVYPGAIDRLFISMVPPTYDGSTTGPIESSPGVYTPIEAEVILSDFSITGGGSSLEIGNIFVRPHDLRLANGYDDTFNITPWRLVRNAVQLGYRNRINHYVGMSHYYSLAWDAGEGRFIIDPTNPLNNVAIIWHEALYRQAGLYGFKIILSLSYELLNQDAPLAWRQLTAGGDPALTGWSPPSTLIAPTNSTALGYLRDVFLALAAIADDAGADVDAQIGEPWWWYQLDTFEPCFYDAVTTALYTTETGNPVPTVHSSIFETPDPAQQDYLDWLGDKLGTSTLWLRDEIKTVYPSAKVMLLFYTPQVLNTAAPMLKSVNFPVNDWVYPAFDRLQVEDYDYVSTADWPSHQAGLDLIDSQLAYPPSGKHYFAGFNLLPETTYIWDYIDTAIDDGRARNFNEIFVWAYSQAVRDGFVYTGAKESEVSGFHEVRFPEAIGFGSTGGPGFLTTVVETASGYEQRNIEWAQARAEYDIGTGLRSEQDLVDIIAFFRARAGRGYGFRFKDWTDFSSCALDDPVAAQDQEIGTGDGVATNFQLIKIYDSGTEQHVRTITKPVTGTVTVALDGIMQGAGWTVDNATGLVTFDTAPGAGILISAGFEFDVPVRFRDDRLMVSVETFRAGNVPSIGLLELRL